jgi:hypothetical protein
LFLGIDIQQTHNNHHNKRRTKKKSKKYSNKNKESQYKEDFKMNGGKGKESKKCMCIDFEKKGSAYINFEDGKKCVSDVVPGTDFCSKHQDCRKFSQKFLNKYELPYNPDLWNKQPDVKNSHNCYTYFLDNQEKESSTNYLFSTEANKKHLNQAIDEVENGQDLIEVDLNELKKGNFPQV